MLGATGASIAVASQLVWNRQVGGFTQLNTASNSMVHTLAALALVAGLGVPCVAGAYLALRRSYEALDRIHRIAHIVSPGMLAMALVLLFNWRAFQYNEALLVVFAACVAFALEGTLRLSLAALTKERIEAWRERLAGSLSDALSRRIVAGALGVLVVSFAVYMSWHAIAQHRAIHTRSYDLAIYDNMMWNLLRGSPLQAWPELQNGASHVSVHATLAAVLLAPFYALWQKPEMLLVLQAALCSSAAIPLYLIVRRRMESRWIALAFTCFYLAYGPLQQPMMYDFHFLTLAPFFVGWTVWAFEANLRWLLVLAFVVTLLVREDVAATVTMAAFACLLSGRRIRWAAGGVLLGTTYFLLMKFAIMPRLAGGTTTFTPLYWHLMTPSQVGLGRALETITLNPAFTLGTLVWLPKPLLVLKVCTPVLFLPFRHRLAWLLLVPAILFTVMTGSWPTWATSFQHVTHWTACIFIATVWVLSDWRTLPTAWYRIPAALGAMAIVGAAMSYQTGMLMQKNTFYSGFRKVEFAISAQDRSNHDDLYALIGMIPPRASVTATETEAPHVSSRPRCYTMRVGNPDADYLLLNVEEASGGRCQDVMREAIEGGRYGLMASRGRYQLWGKGMPTGENGLGAERIGIASGASGSL